jgi:hypothetical protein
MHRTFLALVISVATGPVARGDDGRPDYFSLPPDVLDVLKAAEAIEVLSLDPAADPAKADAKFLGRAVLGTTTVTDKGGRERLVKAVAEGVSAAHVFETGLCFRPRHGLRAKAGGKTLLVGICFECARVELYVDGKEVAAVGTKGIGERHLDDLLTAAKVPLAPRPAKGK